MRWAEIIMIAMFLLHQALCVLFAVYAIGKKRFRLTNFLWAASLPFFGPIVGIIAANLNDKPKDMELIQRLMRRGDDHALNLTTEGKNAIPVEEALLMADSREKRRMMLGILRDEKRSYTDILLMARYNDDTEVSHYATASIMGLQRHYQLELERCAAAVSSEPNDAQAWLEYAQTMCDYIKSGLLEGSLLLRQRKLLREALERLFALSGDTGGEMWTMMAEKIKNDIALGFISDAVEDAESMISQKPDDEAAWLLRLDVCVESRDAFGLPKLLERIESAPVLWSNEALERISYFKRRP